MSQARYMPNSIDDLYREEPGQKEHREKGHKARIVVFLTIGIVLFFGTVLLLRYNIIQTTESETGEMISVVGKDGSVRGYEKFSPILKKSVYIPIYEKFLPQVKYEKTSSGIKVAIQLPEDMDGKEIFIQSYKKSPPKVKVIFYLPKVTAGKGYLVEIPKLRVNLVEMDDLKSKVAARKGTKLFYFYSKMRKVFSSD